MTQRKKFTKKKVSWDFFRNIVAFLFVALLPTQLGKHFFLSFSYLAGLRIDYLAPTIFVMDLLIFALVLLSPPILKSMGKNKVILGIVLALILHTLFVPQVKEIAWYRVFKITEVLFLFYFFKSKGLKSVYILPALCFGAFFETVLVILQFVQKHSIQGVFWFFGERYMFLHLPDVAKAAINGVEFLRPYGTFSHPNSLAGFYLLLYTFVLTSKKEKGHEVLSQIFLLLSSILIFFSFSKTAILMYIFINVLFIFLKKDFSCKLCLFSRGLVLFVLGFVFLSAHTDPLSFAKRIRMFEQAQIIIQKNLFWGVGMGNYLPAQSVLPQSYLLITPQPVHNIFMLMLSEVGIILFSVFTFLLIKRFSSQLLKPSFLLCLLVVLATGSVDHYWITLPQNLLVLPFVFGLLEAGKRI